jgi:2,3-bisphosphoglycerate-independent phosphoglycerate mutase
MKYVIVLGDGMADRPLEQIGGKTPLEYANTPTMDMLAKVSEIGIVHTIPEGMTPGSDTANLSVLGYNPRIYYTGRSPLEAMSIGVEMKDSDIALRCNIVTVSDDFEYDNKTIVDHSSSEITTEDAAILLEVVREELENSEYKFYLGTSYRHLTIWDKGSKDVILTAPHDILGKKIGEYLPENQDLRNMMRKSYEILNNHPINMDRRRKGLNPANSIWFWGAGTRPNLSSFEEKNHVKGAMISAVDLLKGIAVSSSMKNINVEGANATLHTNYEGKANAAIEALKSDSDFVYVHVEAPDEMGHQGNLENKIKAIEFLDERVIKLIYEGLHNEGIDFRMLILPDHPTPIVLRTHTSDPVPFLLYDSTIDKNCNYLYNEKAAVQTGIEISDGFKIIDYLLNK